MNIKDILKQPINRAPVSAQFIQTKSVDPFKKMLIVPEKKVSEFDDKGKEQIERWLALSCVATTILDTSTKALTRLKVISSRDAVHDLIKAFKDLRGYFKGNENYDKLEMEIDEFMFYFLNSSEEHQRRVMKFSESVINKGR